MDSMPQWISPRLMRLSVSLSDANNGSPGLPATDGNSKEYAS